MTEAILALAIVFLGSTLIARAAEAMKKRDQRRAALAVIRARRGR